MVLVVEMESIAGTRLSWTLSRSTTPLIDISPIIREYLSTNLGPDPTRPGCRVMPNYGVSADLNAGTIGVALTFKTGSYYCCTESGCHLDLPDGKRWEKLRRCFLNHGVDAPNQLMLRLSVQIELGALYFDLKRPDKNHRGWFAFRPSEEYKYDVRCMEPPEENAG